MKRSICLVLAIVLSLSLFAGCSNQSGGGSASQQGSAPGESSTPAGEGSTTAGGTPAAETSAHRDTVTVVTHREPVSLIPYGSNDTGSGPVTSIIYETLIQFDENMQLAPCLATEWEQIDETHFRFKLRDDVYFHNGAKLTAEDVLFSFAQSSTAPATANTLGPIDAANSVVEDEHTIVLALNKPFAPFLRTVALGIAGIVNKEAMEADPEGYAANPIGTGPFVFKSWTSGDNWQLTANKEWWGGEINFDNLVIRLVPEAATRAIDLESGNADIAYITVDDATSVDANPNVTLIKQPILNVAFISYNCSREPFNDVKVRQAISCALDADTIAKNTSFGLAQRSHSAVAPTVWGYYDAGEPYGYDVERAKQLLAESSVPNGFTTTLVAMASDTTEAEMIQAYLAEIGITVEIQNVDFAGWLDALVNGKQDIYIGGWTVPSADAAEGFTAFHSEFHGSGGNRSFYTNKDLDPLIEAAESEMDVAKRADLYKQIQEILAEEAVYTQTRVGQMYIGVANGIGGLVTMPTQNLRYHLLTFSE